MLLAARPWRSGNCCLWQRYIVTCRSFRNRVLKRDLRRLWGLILCLGGRRRRGRFGVCGGIRGEVSGTEGVEEIIWRVDCWDGREGCLGGLLGWLLGVVTGQKMRFHVNDYKGYWGMRWDEISCRLSTKNICTIRLECCHGQRFGSFKIEMGCSLRIMNLRNLTLIHDIEMFAAHMQSLVICQCYLRSQVQMILSMTYRKSTPPPIIPHDCSTP